eukprot:3753151-Prymnesium_polylepis.1
MGSVWDESATERRHVGFESGVHDAVVAYRSVPRRHTSPRRISSSLARSTHTLRAGQTSGISRMRMRALPKYCLLGRK